MFVSRADEAGSRDDERYAQTFLAVGFRRSEDFPLLSRDDWSSTRSKGTRCVNNLPQSSRVHQYTEHADSVVEIPYSSAMPRPAATSSKRPPRVEGSWFRRESKYDPTICMVMTSSHDRALRSKGLDF